MGDYFNLRKQEFRCEENSLNSMKQILNISY